MLAHEFVRHALLAGTAIALLCGAVGYFVVLRAQVFAGDALSHVAYTGALGALAAGVDARLGLYGATVGVGLLLGVLGRRAADDVVIGTVFSWILGLGVLFLTLYATHRSTTNGGANVRVLFGSIFGIDRAHAWTAVAVSVGGLAVLALIGRPLMFASLDAAVAGARGVPVRTLGAVFLGLVGLAAAEASQAVGALLLLGLIAAPPAAARLLTSDPWRACGLSAVLAVVAVWVGVTVAYHVATVPVSFAVVACAATVYLLAGLYSMVSRRTVIALRAETRLTGSGGSGRARWESGA